MEVFVCKRKNEGTQQVGIYEIDEEKIFEECSVLRFDSANEEWLDFVAKNRSGDYNGKSYDVIYGPVQMMMYIQHLHSTKLEL